MKRTLLLIGCLILASCGSEEASGDRYDMEALAANKAAFAQTPEAVESGRQLYLKHCALCHGDEGKGDGGAAPYLEPRPRDFTQSLFKFRSTKSGELPTDEDLFRVISRGVPGTTMPAWGEGAFQLSEQQRWELTWYVKVLGGDDFKDPDLSPYAEGAVLPYPEAPIGDAESIARGKAIFTDKKKGGCVKCHGVSGRGNGEEAGAQRDDWGDAILAANVTKSWRLKNGTSAREIFRTLSTGITGTPMPGYAETLSEEKRWDLAFFVRSLIEEPLPSQSPVLVARRAEAGIPAQPGDEAWLAATPLDVPLLGQVVVRPRHNNASVDMVRVRALYDDTEIAFHVTWNDPTQSVKHTTLPGAVTPIDDTFVPAKTLWKRRALKLRDSLQLQFPSRMKKGGAKPFFFLGGGGGGGVNLWRWLADTGAFEDRVQGRATAAATARPKAQQLLSGKAAYDDGRWSLVVRRPRLTEHKKQVQFGAEAVVPFAVQAWDGGNGEEALLCSISSWYYLRLETPIPLSAWLAGGGGLLFALLLGRLLVFLACRVREPEDTPTTSEPEGSAS